MNRAHCLLGLLVYEFWLSGLFVLSVIFLPIEDLDLLTLCTFAAYAVGSFLTGVLSDIAGRRPLFVAFAVLLFGAAALSFFNLWAGLILANLCIGPLNNLTFVLLNETPELSDETNYVKVILGWVAS
jgi:MFS family permease